ncbi:MAG: hypothetical protein V4565_09065 [Bacteroidota bacterium]
MPNPQDTTNNNDKPSEQPIRDIVTGPDFIYIENSDQRGVDWISKIPDINK